MSRQNRITAAAALLLGFAAIGLPGCARSAPPRQNVVLIVTDGFRWQELFGGADSALNNAAFGKVEDIASVRRSYLVGTPEDNRRALLPFIWEVVARQGQIYGNRALGSPAEVLNGYRFSYPGYNEMLTGRPDSRIDRNAYGPNPNTTVFEWLNSQLPGGAAAFGTWDVFADIFDQSHASMRVHAGWQLPFPTSTVPAQVQLDTLYATTTRLWGEMPYDAFMQAAVMEYVRAERPQALYIGFGETDEWAHEGHYDRYLDAAHRVDGFIRDLWDAMQAMPEYAGTTTFIITTDHGRGSGLTQWRDHGAKVEGAQNIWIAVMGPAVPPLGERRETPVVTQAQVAATVAAAVDKDWVAASAPVWTAAPLPVFGIQQ